MEKLLFPFVSIVGQEDMKKALLLNSIIQAIVTITTSFGIDGHRADITMMKAAKANAAGPSRRWLTYIRTSLSGTTAVRTGCPSQVAPAILTPYSISLTG